MKHAEQVTFGGSGFDRAAHLRCDAGQLASLRAGKNAQALAFWRGKPLLDLARNALVFLPLDHGLFQQAIEAPIFLGLEGGTPIFAFNITEWEATDQAQPEGFWDQSQQQHPKLPKGQVFADLRLVMAQLSPREAEFSAICLGVFAWHKSHQFCANCGQPSEISMAGWQRACPGCGRQHFPRTDPVVIMLVTRGNQVLLGRSPHWPEGMFSLLAGFMEPGETIEAAVRREVLEEVDIKIGAVAYLSSQPWPFPASVMIGCHAEALSTEITIDDKEIEAAKWVSKEDVLTAWSDPEGSLMSARKGSIANFLIRNWLSDTLS